MPVPQVPKVTSNAQLKKGSWSFFSSLLWIEPSGAAHLQVWGPVVGVEKEESEQLKHLLVPPGQGRHLQSSMG